MSFHKPKKPTIDDLASISGVSRSTVIRYLQGNQIRTNLQNAIDQAIGILNYPLQRAPQEETQFSVLVSVPKGYADFRGYTTIVEGIMAQAGKHRILVRLSDEPLQGARADGVLLLGKDMETEIRDHEYLAKENIPCMFINRWYPQEGFNFTAVNSIEAAFHGVSHLLQLGCTRIAAGPFNKKALVDVQKLQGYKLALEKWNLQYNESLIFKTGSSGFPEGEVDGFFGFDDSYAMEFIRFSKNLGKKIPQDIKVMGMNNLDLSQLSDPALTTISFPFRTMGTTSINLLLTLLENPGCGDVKLRLPFELIQRETC